MNANEITKRISDHFRPNAIKGDLKPSRAYEIVESEPARLKIRTRTRDGKVIQSLFATLMTCKSQRHGEFRRVDLAWGMERKGKDREVESPDEKPGRDDEFELDAMPYVEPASDDSFVPVDKFMAHGFGGHSSCRIRRRKAS
ncbi:MAG TPA: hypothetical protein PKW95_13300 [bacterium]|nr:hypothetical protein [bacterium]